MGPKCVVPRCKSGYNSNHEKVSVFSIPKNKIEEWQRAIPGVDRKLTSKDVVCAKHFKEEDIIRQVQTDVYSYDLKRPRLSVDAVPCIFPECPSYLTKNTKKRRIRQRKKIPVKRSKRTDPENIESDENGISDCECVFYDGKKECITKKVIKYQKNER